MMHGWHSGCKAVRRESEGIESVALAKETKRDGDAGGVGKEKEQDCDRVTRVLDIKRIRVDP